VLPTTARLMSADDHIIEPPDLWVYRVPARFRADCPRVVEVDGRQAWSWQGELTYIPMGSCRPLPGFDEAGYPPAPGTARFDEIRPGCYDPVERIKDMDVDGVWGSSASPTSPVSPATDSIWTSPTPSSGSPASAPTTTTCSTSGAPPRRRGCSARSSSRCTTPTRPSPSSSASWRRAPGRSRSENPTVLGLPSVHTDHWDRLWAIADEAEVPVCMHIGSSSRLVTTSDDAPTTVLVSLNGLNSMMAGVDWLMSGVLDRFPRLKIVLSEGGAGWIPYILERAEKAFHDPRLEANAAIGQSRRGGTPPSELFAQHVYVCLVDEHFALKVLGDIPVDNLLWEGDYPHGDGLWPHNHSYLENALADVPDADALQIAETNLRGLLHA
jgi:Amidohydrolase